MQAWTLGLEGTPGYLVGHISSRVGSTNVTWRKPSDWPAKPARSRRRQVSHRKPLAAVESRQRAHSLVWTALKCELSH